MSIDHAEMTFCTIDQKLIEDSPIYAEIVRERGEDFARHLTYTVMVPLTFDAAMQGSEELQHAVYAITGGIKPGGKIA